MATDDDPARAEGGSREAGAPASASPGVPTTPADPGVVGPSPGDVLAGKFRVERVVGVGGMGVVVAVRHLVLEERVALKLLKREVMRPDTIARFLREARSAAKIKSEHVARVTDVGTLDGGIPYMIMELLEGEDLGLLVRERGALSPARAADYVLQACEAVAEAHALGIVHRDLKPANLFLARRPGGHRVVKVLDFGISKQTGGGGAPMPLEDAATTRASTWLGSPLYMSPEQMRSAKDVDHRTDIWALGVTLFELCTGRIPFNAATPIELCASVLQDEATPLETWLPDPPPALVAAIAGCLHKNRDERFPSVAELALALAPLAPDARARVDRIVSIVEGVASTHPGPSRDDEELPVPLVRPSNPSLVERSRPPEPAPVAAVSGPPPRTSANPPTSGAGPWPEDTIPDPGRSSRRWGLWLALLLVLGAGGGYLRFRARAWPFGGPAPVASTDIAPTVVPSTPPTSSVGASSPAAAPSVVVPPTTAVADSGAPAAGLTTETSADAGTGRLIGRPRMGPPSVGTRATPRPTVGQPSSALWPKPEVTITRCTEMGDDGITKVIPCPPSP